MSYQNSWSWFLKPRAQAKEKELTAKPDDAALKAEVEALQAAVQKAAEDRGGMWAGLAAGLIMGGINSATNIADTRTWTSLPKEFQYCSFPTPVDGKLRVSAPNTQQAEVAVDPKSTNLILVRSVSPLSPLVVTAIRLK